MPVPRAPSAGIRCIVPGAASDTVAGPVLTAVPAGPLPGRASGLMSWVPMMYRSPTATAPLAASQGIHRWREALPL